MAHSADTTEIETEETNDEQQKFRNYHMRSAYYWAAQIDGWMTDGPNAGLEGQYYVQVMAGKPILVLDKDEFTEEIVDHMKRSLIGHGFPDTVRKRERDDEWRLFVEEHTDAKWLQSNYEPEWRAFESQTDFEDTAFEH
jgi:hypothetical protein